jgi:hypothetical protein
MLRPWVTHDRDSVGSLGLRGRPFSQVWVFPWVLACIPFIHIEFLPWDAFSLIGFVGVDGFNPIMKKLISARFDLGFVDVHGLGLHEVQKWLRLIRVLGSFSYKDLSKILAKFGFMMGNCKTELERDYCVSILDKDSISNMETKGWQHMRVNSLIYLSIISKDSFFTRRARGI